MDHFQRAVEIAEATWSRDILDEQIIDGVHYDADKKEIEEIILNGGGQTWLNWVDGKYGGYVDRKVEWCGFFVGSCFPSLDADIKKYVLPSCYRLEKNWGKTRFSKPEYVDPKDIRPGDIVVKENAGSSVEEWGDHIMLATSIVNRGTFNTIEGNAYGRTPTERRAEGVVKNSRNIKDVFAVYRLNPEMLNG